MASTARGEFGRHGQPCEVGSRAVLGESDVIGPEWLHLEADHRHCGSLEDPLERVVAVSMGTARGPHRAAYRT